jgi:hypothetical protein
MGEVKFPLGVMIPANPPEPGAWKEICETCEVRAKLFGGTVKLDVAKPL